MIRPREYEAVGVTHVHLTVGAPYDHASPRLFADQVVPAVRA